MVFIYLKNAFILDFKIMMAGKTGIVQNGTDML